MKVVYESGSCSLTQLETLQNKVFLEIMLFFCRRGRQNLREWKKEDFSVCTDSSSVRYVCKVKDELTRNWRENNDAQESQCVKVVGLFAQFCHLKNVTCLNLKNEYLFQRPKKGVDESDLVRHHGRWPTHSWWEDEEVAYRSKAIWCVYESFNQSNYDHETWRVRIQSPAYNGNVRSQEWK